jgi:hypothetical protein
MPREHEHAAPVLPVLIDTPPPAEDGADEGMPSASADAVTVPLPSLNDCRVRFVVVDCSSLVDVDDSALAMLRALPSQTQATLVFAALKAPVRDLLTKVHFFPAEKESSSVTDATGQPTVAAAKAFVPIERPFVTTHEAVKFCRRRIKQLEDTPAAAPIGAALTSAV